ncbi:octaprenyl-diphosphate synthase [Natronospira proteinivora]|uniref:Octaprenyl-diphosphate synthase n=1 Tax=Natronospira proteinivora TaxID=1807133 RepID=A0ABT1G7K8_9GAMM|nr:octaprenyl diphosphate synthase [Natronospira proteinivora]MCP1726308.1 octaprenyl-diphosphate synthase [Natronospira proteinivora]
MPLQSIRELVRDDFAAVDQEIQRQLNSDIVLINQLGHYIINSGGKRLRPLLVLLAARAAGSEGAKPVTMAAVIEFIHTATLLHDDVVDASELRRGRDTANALWGNEAAVLVGDFLYSRSFQMMVSLARPRIMDVMADATNQIAEGEVLQLLNCNDPDTTEERYLEVIRRKTATLFAAGTQTAAILSDAPEATEKALQDYGMALGEAFQIIDDVLDYSASAEDMGKNVGDDLAEGKPTLPLIHAMREGSREDREMIRRAIEQGGLDQIEAILKTLGETGALEYAAQQAHAAADRAEQALAPLPDGPYKEALGKLARFSVERAS